MTLAVVTRAPRHGDVKPEYKLPPRASGARTHDLDLALRRLSRWERCSISAPGLLASGPIHSEAERPADRDHIALIETVRASGRGLPLIFLYSQIPIRRVYRWPLQTPMS